MEDQRSEWGLVSHCNMQEEGIWPDGNSARNYAYTTSPENRILGLTESVASTATETWGYGYDLADRLVNALATPSGAYTYGLDAGDNLLSIQTGKRHSTNSLFWTATGCLPDVNLPLTQLFLRPPSRRFSAVCRVGAMQLLAPCL